MGDKVKVDVVNTKVFHDGTSMIVLNAGKKGNIDPEFLDSLVADGTVKAPRGYKAPEEREPEPEAKVLDAFVTEQDDGSFNVQSPWMEEPESLKDLEAANTRAAEVRETGDPAASAGDAPAT